jgi:hypothetical protein
MLFSSFFFFFFFFQNFLFFSAFSPATPQTQQSRHPPLVTCKWCYQWDNLSLPPALITPGRSNQFVPLCPSTGVALTPLPHSEPHFTASSTKSSQKLLTPPTLCFQRVCSAPKWSTWSSHFVGNVGAIDHALIPSLPRPREPNLLQMSARSSAQSITAGASWQISHL